jgi:hypothetical protein
MYILFGTIDFHYKNYTFQHESERRKNTIWNIYIFKFILNSYIFINVKFSTDI